MGPSTTTVLVVDPYKEDREYWVHRLHVSSPEYRVLEADTGRAGLAVCESQRVDCVVTDCWLSMGDEEKTVRAKLLRPFQVDGALMALAAPEALFMHCLPAHRGEEVTDEVIDGPQSVVFDEAENRLHAQKGIIAWCFGIGS